MMKIKKLLIWILTAVLLMGIMPMTYAMGNDSEAANQEMISLLADLGIIRSYQPESYVALSDLSDALTVITGNQNTVSQYFDGSRIRANRALKYSEILLVLVDITGYTPYLDLKYGGVNKTGYIGLASKVGITKGVNVRYEENVTGADYARMLYNTLFVDMLRQTVYGEKQQYRTEKGKNLLTEKMELTPIKDVVRAAGLTSLDKEGWYSNGGRTQKIRIGSQDYNCSFTFLEEDIVGRTVEAYIHQETNTAAAVVIPERRNNILHLTGEDLKDVPDVKNSNFSYWDEGGRRSRTGRLSQTVDVVYNGALLPDYEATHFTEGDTVITMVDNNLDEIYDVVLIDDYISSVFHQISTDRNTITDTEGLAHDFTRFTDNNLSFMDDKGEKIAAERLESGSVMSVRFDKDGQPNRVFVSKERVQGVLQQIDKEEKSIVLDGTEYPCEKRFYDSGKLNNIHLGSGVTAYIDVWGRVVLTESYESVWKFAWLFNAADGRGLSSAKLLMIDEENRYGEAEISDRFTFNGKRMEHDKLLSRAELLDNTGAFKPQLIRFRKNTKGEVTAIETAGYNHELGGTMSSPDAFELNYEYTGKEGHKTMRPYKVNNQIWLGTKYVAPPETLLFTISTSDKELSHVGTASTLPTDSGLRLSLYNVDKDYAPQVIVYSTNAYSSTANVYNYTTPYVLDDIMQAVNDEGEIVLRLSAYKGSELVTFDVPDSTLTASTYNIIFYNWLSADKKTAVRELPISALPAGTVFQVQTLPGTNEVRSFAILYTPIKELEIPPFVDSTDTASNEYDWSDGYHFSGNGLSSYAQVLQKTKYGVVMNIPDRNHKSEVGATVWNRHIMFSNSTLVYIVDTKTGRIHLGSWADIDVGDMLYLHRNKTTIMAAVLYE